MFDVPLLSLVIWLPIVGGCWVLFAGARSGPTARALALVVASLTFVLSIPLYIGFDVGTYAMQFQERTLWIEPFDIYYHLGVDGLSMPLILLTTFTTVLVILAAWEVIQDKPAQYLAAFLIQEGFMNGAFAALDSMLFYVFWEAQLIPMFLIIGVWGGAAADLRERQVLPVHLPRLGADVGRSALPLRQERLVCDSRSA